MKPRGNDVEIQSTNLPLNDSNPQQPQKIQQDMLPQNCVLLQNQKYFLTEDPINELQNSVSAKIIQETDITQRITGCEMPNRYNICVKNKDGDCKFLFKCKEQSTQCQRCCVHPSVRSFNMKMKHIVTSALNNDDYKKLFATFEKPFKCTSFCCARPQMIGQFAHNKEVFGKVKDVYTCCDPLIHVLNKDNTVRYRITGDCSQCSFFCRGCCGKMFETMFSIYNGTGSIKGAKPIGQIKRQIAKIEYLITDADSYEIVFPEEASSEEKLILISAVLMLDYQYYESNIPSSNKQNSKMLRQQQRMVV